MSVLARRYASALLQAADPSESQRILDELEVLLGVFRGQGELRKVLENPGIALDEKKAFLAAFGEKVGVLPAVIRFLDLLTQRRRVTLLPDAVEAYRNLLDARAGRMRARLTTATPLGEARVRELAGRLAAALGHPVAMESAVRGELIAGAQLQVGSTVFDGSVAGALKALNRTLVKGSA